ncbi:histidine utilization repressor [Nocardia panacis]|uniref:Histidine utilization repressor n=1 Tax=Nocardia panacis TaxID=2340916 RepID=A0A3A4KVK1_9NOCA|nr:histidine utilization repressor [Nocardia panacis]RJO79270.1 histidine utilization repressor [Nocardia panacis]
MAGVVDDVDLRELYAAAEPRSAPAYERIKTLIRAQIGAGRWVAGDQLPSEHQLVRELGISRMTINRALRELAAAGVVVRNMGVGTFVAPAKVAAPLFEVRNIADEIQRRGHRHRMGVVLLRREPLAEHPLPADWSADHVFHSVLVHFDDDVPIQLEDRFVDPVIVPDYLAQDFTTVTPNRYLSAVAPLVRGEHVVEAVQANPEEARLLRIRRTEPCLQIRRRTWSAKGLVSSARLLHPGSRSRLEGTFEA